MKDDRTAGCTHPADNPDMIRCDACGKWRHIDEMDGYWDGIRNDTDIWVAICKDSCDDDDDTIFVEEG